MFGASWRNASHAPVVVSRSSERTLRSRARAGTGSRTARSSCPAGRHSARRWQRRPARSRPPGWPSRGGCSDRSWRGAGRFERTVLGEARLDLAHRIGKGEDRDPAAAAVRELDDRRQRRAHVPRAIAVPGAPVAPPRPVLPDRRDGRASTIVSAAAARISVSHMVWRSSRGYSRLDGSAEKLVHGGTIPSPHASATAPRRWSRIGMSQQSAGKSAQVVTGLASGLPFSTT